MDKVEIIPQSILDEVELIKQGCQVCRSRRLGRRFIQQLLETEDWDENNNDNNVIKQLNNDNRISEIK